jgi:hypothetical protein
MGLRVPRFRVHLLVYDFQMLLEAPFSELSGADVAVGIVVHAL